MIVQIDYDERWPDYFVTTESGLNPGQIGVEVSDKELARWKRVQKAYERVQDEMEEAWKNRPRVEVKKEL